MHNILAGRQIPIPFRTLDDLQFVLRQHERFGMKPVDQIEKGFCGITYRIDRPINVESIEAGISQRDQDAIDRALEARRLTAVVQDDLLLKKGQELGVHQRSSIEVEITEEKQNAADTTPKLSQIIGVEREGMQPAQGARRGRKPKGR